MPTSLSKTQRGGLLFAFIGVFAFSLSLPFTKMALKSFDPLFTAFARPVIAASLAIPLMLFLKVPALPRHLWRPMAFTALGAVFGWPILIAIALDRTTSSHVSVISAVMEEMDTPRISTVLSTNAKFKFRLNCTCLISSNFDQKSNSILVE